MSSTGYLRGLVLAGTAAISAMAGQLTPAYALPVQPPRDRSVLESASVPNGAVDAPIRLLGEFYDMDDYISVRHCVLNNPDVVAPLALATGAIQNVFGENHYLVLRVSRADTVDGSAELIADIFTGLDPIAALDSLERFNDWWLPQSRQYLGTLAFNLRFR